MDWKGQKLVEQMIQILLMVFAVAALAVGYALGSFQTMMLIYASGVVITSFITIPDWPFLSRHPLKWLDPSQAEEHPKPELVVANSTSTKKKNSKKLWYKPFVVTRLPELHDLVVFASGPSGYAQCNYHNSLIPP